MTATQKPQPEIMCQKARAARKALLLQRLRKTTVFSVNMEELLELIGIVAEEKVEEMDTQGFFEGYVEEAVE